MWRLQSPFLLLLIGLLLQLLVIACSVNILGTFSLNGRFGLLFKFFFSMFYNLWCCSSSGLRLLLCLNLIIGGWWLISLISFSNGHVILVVQLVQATALIILFLYLHWPGSSLLRLFDHWSLRCKTGRLHGIERHRVLVKVKRFVLTSRTIILTWTNVIVLNSYRVVGQLTSGCSHLSLFFGFIV